MIVLLDKKVYFIKSNVCFIESNFHAHTKKIVLLNKTVCFIKNNFYINHNNFYANKNKDCFVENETRSVLINTNELKDKNTFMCCLSNQKPICYSMKRKINIEYC